MQVQDTQASRVADMLRRQLGAALVQYLAEPDVVEIMLNPDGKLWVERLGGGMEQVGTMTPSNAEAIMTTVASVYRTTITRDNPILECELPFDGSRLECLIPPVVSAPTFSIRRRAGLVFTLDQYVASGIINDEQNRAIRWSVDNRRSILVVGGTGTGKTTLTNAIVDHMAESTPDDRFVIIEDTAELQCRARNFVTLRSTDTVDMNRLLRATMRLRPSRIIVGEVRGVEALTLIDAWNTGHPGGVATVHANDAASGLVRIGALVRRATQGEPPVQEIAAAIDTIVCIEKTNRGRRVSEVLRVLGHDGVKYCTEPLVV